jgi:hypothetical protein
MSLLRWPLLGAVVVSLIATVVTCRRVAETRRDLTTPAAPNAIVSLELARSVREATTIVDQWQARSVLPVARENLDRDYLFIAAYASALCLAALLVLVALEAPVWLRVATPLAALAAGACDVLENLLLGSELGATPPLDVLARVSSCLLPWAAGNTFALARLFAQTKFVLVLGVVLVIVTASLAIWRRWWLGVATTPPTARTFKDLVEKERDGILAGSRRVGTDDLETVDGSSGEPWVKFRVRDLVGLALSGGGIRSATFNLGLLTGLARLNVLRRVDYLTTVSGGGYVGSFWTAYMANRAQATDPAWPPRSPVEPGPVRHLREFSRFLAPRIGFFESEMWEAVVAVVAGLLPALASAVSVVGLGIVAWLALNFFLACPHPWAGVLTVCGLTAAMLVVFERLWWASRRLDPGDVPVSLQVNVASAIVAVVLVGCLQYRFVDPSRRAYEDWWALTGVAVRPGTGSPWFISPALFELALVWLAAGGLLLALRPLCLIVLRGSLRQRVGMPAFDRTLMRLLGSGVGWASIALLWHLSVNLELFWRSLIAASILSAALFARLRNWIGTAFRMGRQVGTLERLKPVLPQLLAYGTVALVVVVVGSMLIAWGRDDWSAWYEAVAVMGLVVAIMLLLDPAEIGLHAFYRDRIVRAYPGASNPNAASAAQNRITDPRAGDDPKLGTLPTWPLHLVCCAANDVSGDPVETLGRGARSAVLSHHGVAMGNGWATPPEKLTLGGAVTASAAAFNSNMGAVSMSVGPVVSFLMAALNLRLGLWVPNPCRRPSPRPRLLPGVLFFREMFALTFADDDVDDLHLSDGGHFENLALYELVRRHCRYIIVSDCGEDPSVAFDDFGNAARRIREDFGVDVEVDLGALHPDAQRRSRQHAVVGTIHYSDFDKGIIVYVKPTLTGDEPPDVEQYAARNSRFPHEPTSDQFYDEAQWESYRKLGEHTARVAFGFVDRYRPEVPTPNPEPPADWIFTTAQRDWYPTSAGLAERIGRMTERFVQLEAELQRTPALPLLAEVFTELRWLHLDPDPHPATPAAEVASLTCLLLVTQLMENVWAQCELDTAWNHPLNLGWMNGFARWASAPRFRMWWPLLRPRYAAGFQRFMQERFPALDEDGAATGDVSGPTADLPDGLAAEWWRERQGTRPVLTDGLGSAKEVYAYSLDLRSNVGGARIQVQVGLVLVRRMQDATGTWAWWTSDDFSIPPSLWGADFGGDFLRDLVKRLRQQGIGRLVVYVNAPPKRNDPGSWAERLGYAAFYKKEGFETVDPAVTQLPDNTPCRALKLVLP